MLGDLIFSGLALALGAVLAVGGSLAGGLALADGVTVRSSRNFAIGAFGLALMLGAMFKLLGLA